MELHINKPKVQKSLSYALKTSYLQNAIEEAKLEGYVQLEYWTPQSGNSILECVYWLPNQNVPYPRFYIRAGTVLNQDRQTASQLLKLKVIPKLIDWMKKKQSSDFSAKLGTGYFGVTFQNNDVTISSK